MDFDSRDVCGEARSSTTGASLFAELRRLVIHFKS
jgi:hypothetical protein